MRKYINSAKVVPTILMKRGFVLIIIFLFIFAFIFAAAELLLINRAHKKENLVCFKDNCFKVELALTEKERERGLMLRNYLDSNAGMFFVFEKEEEYPFWMKNTKIPLDIIWINENKEIVFLRKNVQPCRETGCEIVAPDKKARYVLEINGGMSDKINLKPGDKLIFNIIGN